MTSQAQAEAPLTEVQGLVFFGFPLYPAKKPSDARAQHLSQVQIPMLFLQGTRDALADMALLDTVIDKLGKKATLVKADDGDHSFHVPKRSGRTDAQVLAQILNALVRWMAVTAQPMGAA
jgi:predicted alpha/beta-hydrolase family hydrolase